jgi:aromatic-L-amino-acid/L-tryptophan decarboxylase
MQLTLDIIKIKRDDNNPAQQLFEMVNAHYELQAISRRSNTVTFRFIPGDYFSIDPAPYLNCLNEEIVNRIQDGGEVWISHAIVANKYCIRARIVKSKTQLKDIEVLVKLVTRTGRSIREEWKERESTIN